MGGTPMAKTASSSSASGSKPKTSAASSGPTSASSQAASNGSHASLQTYREIFIARSDGIGYTTQQLNDASRSAQPVGDALDDSHEFVRSWTVKLGKAIKYNLGSAAAGADPNNYLVRFPQGYSLHVRPGKTKDRDGPLVFGHPLGPLAAFRSPAELALHILWLMSDSKERADCSCRLCVRMVSEAAAASAASVAAAAPVSVKASPRAPTVTPVPVPVIPAASPAVPTTATAAPPPMVSPAIAATAAQPNILAVPVGGSSGLFRPWELVWYQHFIQASRGTWRLGIVLQVFPSNDGQAYPPSTMPGPAGSVRVAPLGITGLHPPELTLDTSALRPFLSFSVPAMRDGFQGVTYDQIDWQALAWEAQQYHHQQQQQQVPQPPQPGRLDTTALALEASKSAANQINACFSVFNPKPKASAAQCMYGGVFLGAEQILLGDAIRVDVKDVMAGSGDESNSNVFIMRVNLIMTDNGDLRFFGDTYRLSVTAPGEQPPPQAVASTPAGEVFAEELAQRNNGAVPDAPTWYWQLRETNSSRNELEVHGRFYASSRLAANLQNAEFLQRVAQQQSTQFVGADDSSIMASALNRRPTVAGFIYQGQRANRAATIGQAMSVQLPPVNGVQEEY
ncbi:hypothetical protein SBRCBS47491_001211 [Sporothrix bragantina]|uniref:Transcription-silencing protein clr2 n=1 Tax=Sporothrix bragantina TaxID=671064 RepID=A0ABP0AWR1_9PEZI